MSVAIQFESISKQYRLGLVSTRTLSHDLNRWVQTALLGREDPYLKIGETNDRSVRGGSEYVWALRDINLEVREGEVLGIIGRNGAGKSTLLKILSRVTAPTTGIIRARGRIASLLEVGTGFHPEMTGRENIFMNGAIMGMTKAEIRRKLDSIVDFAGVERYLDTPVKRYSSGMIVRLGFAVAAHLEPEILVVDEVLAVGDAEFQKKAIGKMQDVSSQEGRTVLFVSHNMTAINDLCQTAVILDDGEVTFSGKSSDAVINYLSSFDDFATEKIWSGEDSPGNTDIKLRKVYFIDANHSPVSHVYVNQEFGFCVEYEVLVEVPFFTHGINVYDSLDHHIFTSHDSMHFDKHSFIKPGNYKTVAWLPKDLLRDDKYEFSFACMRYNPYDVLFHERGLIKIPVLETLNAETRNENYTGHLPGMIRPLLKWDDRKAIRTFHP